MKKRLLEFYSRLGIRSKLLLGYSAIFVFFILVSCFLLFPIIRSVIESNTEDSLNNMTKLILQTVKTTAQASVKNYLRAIAEKNEEVVAEIYKMYEAGLISEDEAKERAKAVLLSQHIGKTGYIYCLDGKGVIRMHPVAELLGADLSSHGFIQEQLARKEGYLEYAWKNPGEKKERLKALYMTYFKPWDWIISVSSYRDEFNALVNVDNFRDNILSIRVGKTGYPFIINSSGTLIIHPYLQGKNIYASRDVKGWAFVEQMCLQKKGKIVYPWRNPNEKEFREKIVVFDYIPEYDWIVAASSYVDEINAPLVHVRNVLIVVFGVAMVLLLLLTVFYSSSIVRSLDRLIAGFQSVGKKDFTTRIPKLSGDEFGRLSEGFNRFMDKLEAYHLSLEQEMLRREKAEEDLKRSHDELEARVVERTYELAQANQKLTREVSDRQHAQELLTYSEQFMSGIFASIQDGILVLDKELRVLRVNVGMERMFPRDVSTVGFRCFEVLHNRQDPCEDCPAARTWASGKTQHHVMPRKDRQGNVVAWLELFSFPLVNQDTREVYGVIIYVRDITERQRAEDDLKKAYADLKAMQEQLLQSEKMATVGQLAAGVAHEINNPTGFVKTNLYVLDDYIAVINGVLERYKKIDVLYHDRAMEPRLLDALAEVFRFKEDADFETIISDLPKLSLQSMDGMNRIERIVRDLMSFSHSDDGRKENVDLHMVIESAINIAWNEVKYKADIVREFGDMPRISCYPQMLSQVFLNLIVNASHAMGERGVITIKTFMDRDDAVVLVSDTGFGMSEDVKKRIFEPFFTTKPVGKGTGLGLSLVYNIIEKHEGSITVDSAPGQGAVFTIRLPQRLSLAEDKS